MTQDEIIEMAIQGHAGTRDAIRWAMQQEREACATVCDSFYLSWIGIQGRYEFMGEGASECAAAIRARGQA